MYVECVITRDNASLLHFIVAKVKTVRDARAGYDVEHPSLDEVTEDNVVSLLSLSLRVA